MEGGGGEGDMMELCLGLPRGGAVRVAFQPCSPFLNHAPPPLQVTGQVDEAACPQLSHGDHPSPRSKGAKEFKKFKHASTSS